MQTLWFFIIVGFLAQVVDGALGMAYGTISNALLLSAGVPPAISSASVHFAEIFTTSISGFSHLKLGNVDKSLFKKLLIPGIVGGVLGAYILTNIDGDKIKPFIGIYLLIMGIRILYKVTTMHKHSEEKITRRRHYSILGLLGGFFDAIGGGGWGPIVTSTLVSDGKNPRKTIGSVNAAEFFVTISEVVTFFALLSQFNWSVIIGLIIGGSLAAPIAALITKKIPAKVLMISLGCIITFLSIRMIVF
ncbi:sulfite exporter TauE/SafE family protein [Petrotoga sp. 8T1HF07.NaAc.6.1]|uniref:sulfite exporter TauE/SafE family protein n=1 Tax=Petrotoga sp. 8T1HF07.NaAc.6.1 TaxID=1351838 RepID=UPI00192C5973|nr:sulfite exporter TauE/SafE family protein [Petrotoga sp. 8T1HF07.NaAc.6.1]